VTNRKVSFLMINIVRWRCILGDGDVLRPLRKVGKIGQLSSYWTGLYVCRQGGKSVEDNSWMTSRGYVQKRRRLS